MNTIQITLTLTTPLDADAAEDFALELIEEARAHHLAPGEALELTQVREEEDAPTVIEAEQNAGLARVRAWRADRRRCREGDDQ